MAINTLFQNIANAIRSVNSSSDTYTPEEMPEAIMNLSTGDMLKSDYDPNETVLNAGGIVAYTADAISGKADSATTLAGYGITDAYTITQVDTLLSGKADSSTTLAGYGITDAYTSTQIDTLLSGKADSATTLSGYGITDAYTSTQIDTLLSGKADSATTLSGYGITDAYTSTQIDTLLSAKADSATTLSGYGITDAYTKTETDTLLTAKANASDLSSLSDTVDTNTNNISALNSSLTNYLDTISTELNVYNVLYSYVTASKVSNGITWTVNDDGTITVSGTATSASYFNLDFDTNIGFSDLRIGKSYAYYVSDTSTLVRMYIGCFTDSTGTNISLTNSYTMGTFTVPSTFVSSRCYLVVESGNTVNATIRPMIIPKTIYDALGIKSTSFAMTNHQITERITPITQSFEYDGCTFYIDFYPNYSVLYTTGATTSAITTTNWTQIGTVTNPYKQTRYGHLIANNGSIYKIHLGVSGTVNIMTLQVGSGSTLYVQDSCILR